MTFNISGTIKWIFIHLKTCGLQSEESSIDLCVWSCPRWKGRLCLCCTYVSALRQTKSIRLPERDESCYNTLMPWWIAQAVMVLDGRRSMLFWVLNDLAHEDLDYEMSRFLWSFGLNIFYSGIKYIEKIWCGLKCDITLSKMDAMIWFSIK